MSERRRAVAIAAIVLLGATPLSGGDISATHAGEYMTAPDQPNVSRLAYGDDPAQFGDLWLPDNSTGPLPVVVLVHGGFWRAMYELDLMDPLAADLVARGYAVWNIEYRRVGMDGGGYPGTLTDVAAAIDHLPAMSAGPLDLDDVTFIGHSAGGHLAFWAAGRDRLPTGRPGSDPAVMPRLVIGQGPVGDLVAAAEAGAGNGAVVDLMGGTPDDLSEEYASANPHIGDAVQVVVVRGSNDDIVAPDYTVPDSATPPTVIDVTGDDHFDLIDPTSDSWARIIEVVTHPN